MELLTLRDFKDGDLPVFDAWLHRPHVAKWYGDLDEWMEEVQNRNSSYTWIHHFIVSFEDRDIGFCQYYEYAKGGEDWHGNVVVPGTYSIDYLIGEPEYLGMGLGCEMIKKLLDLISSLPDAKRVIAQPEGENAASCNTLLSAGFEYDADNKLYLFPIR